MKGELCSALGNGRRLVTQESSSPFLRSKIVNCSVSHVYFLCESGVLLWSEGLDLSSAYVLPIS